MTGRIAASLAALAILRGAACANGDAREPAGAFVRDSAGVLIVENRVQSEDLPVWHLSESPTLDIGGDEADPSQQLFDVAGAARLSDGSIVIAEDGNLRLRFYEPGGEWSFDSGRSGEGPGEFRDLGRPNVIGGDSVVVYDVRLRRFSLLSPDGTHARSWSLEQPLPGDAVTPVIFLPGMQWLARPGFSFSSSTPTGIHRGEVPYFRFAFDGTFVDSVGRFPAAETYVYSDGERSMAISLPMLRSAYLSPAADGGFWFGSGDRYEIGKRAGDGRLVALIRGVDVDVGMPAGRLDAWKRELIGEMEADQRPLFERVLAALPDVESLPAHSNLRSDAAGNLWVRDHVWGDESRVAWRIFAPDGQALARIGLPSNLTIDQIGEDWLLGTWSDDLGIEHVRLWSLEKGNPPAAP